MAWLWDSYDTYRLNKADVEDHLTELFGNYDFLISVS